jgi:hypothetical protein
MAQELATYLDSLVTGEKLIGFFSLNGRVDDNLLSRLPVDRSGDSVLVAQLEGIDDS